VEMRGPEGKSRRGSWLIGGRRMVIAAALVTTMAAATATTLAGAGPAAATTSGPTWSPSKAPLPNGAATNPDVSVTSLACPTANSCVAVGYYTDDDSVQQGLLLVRTSSTWRATEAPLAAGSTNVTLNAVACSAADNCVAVGYYDNPGLTPEPLLLTLSAHNWTQQVISGSSGGLMTVGCSASAGCVAGDSSNNVVALVSGAWTATSITGPVPGGSSSYQWDISGIACTALCYPVGAENMGGDPGNFSQAAVVASGSGTDWTARLAPLPGNAEPRTGTDQRAYVNGVACRSSQCTAAGSYIDTSGHEQALLLAHSGTRWTAAESPLPTGAASVPEARLDAVACPSTTSCVVVGTYNDSISGRAQGLIDSGAGRVFTPTEAPLPSGGVSVEDLTGVACASTTVCSVVGTFFTSSSADGILLTGSGTSWTATAAPRPRHGLADSETTRAVACASSATCVAVGEYLTRTTQQGLIETLHGA